MHKSTLLKVRLGFISFDPLETVWQEINHHIFLEASLKLKLSVSNHA